MIWTVSLKEIYNFKIKYHKHLDYLNQWWYLKMFLKNSIVCLNQPLLAKLLTQKGTEINWQTPVWIIAIKTHKHKTGAVAW